MGGERWEISASKERVTGTGFTIPPETSKINNNVFQTLNMRNFRTLIPDNGATNKVSLMITLGYCLKRISIPQSGKPGEDSSSLSLRDKTGSLTAEAARGLEFTPKETEE